MLTTETLAAHPDFTVRRVHCPGGHAGWSPAEPVERFGLVLVQAGRFGRVAWGGQVLADPSVGFLTVPGDEERYAHPAGGDVCLSIHVTETLWRELRPDLPEPGPHRVDARQVYVDARLEVAHRALTGQPGPDPDFAAAERVVRLVGAAIAATPGNGAASPADRRAVDAAREAIVAGDRAAAGLVPLARRLGVSPYRLSRAFTRTLGVSVTRYRNRVRVGVALRRLAAGESHLGRLAAELGFADQAHLTRTVRAHTGSTPTQLRGAHSDGAGGVGTGRPVSGVSQMPVGIRRSR